MIFSFFIIRCERWYYVWNTTSFKCDLHAKYCKHWFLWGHFLPLFDTYWSVSQPIALRTFGLSSMTSVSSELQKRQFCLHIHRVCNVLHGWRKFCSKNCRPPWRQKLVKTFDNFHALRDSYAIHFHQCQTFNWKERNWFRNMVWQMLNSSLILLKSRNE